MLKHVGYLFASFSFVFLAGCSTPQLAQTAEVTFATAEPTFIYTPAIPPPNAQNSPINIVCDAEIETLETYVPIANDFIRLTDNGFALGDARYPIYGANYYPKDTPYGAFLTETQPEVFAEEMLLMREAGINTLRVFLHHADLFLCEGGNTKVSSTAFDILEALIAEAHEQELRLIMVMNADIAPYEQSDLALAQMQFIMERYQDEATILAWDLRDRGDWDYATYSRDVVLAWLAETSAQLQPSLPHHALTAGWVEDGLATLPYVDFVSFQHYGEYLDLRERIANLRSESNKPILLSAIGYSTQALDETAQRNLLFQAFEEIRHNRLLGWTVYMAFDYPLPALCADENLCTDEQRILQRYGIWNTSYFPKLTVEAIERVTNVND
jgi:hypothetical protein